LDHQYIYSYLDNSNSFALFVSEQKIGLNKELYRLFSNNPYIFVTFKYHLILKKLLLKLILASVLASFTLA
jgi:hypothetical protein